MDNLVHQLLSHLLQVANKYRQTNNYQRNQQALLHHNRDKFYLVLHVLEKITEYACNQILR